MAELPQCPIGVHCPGTDYPVSNFSSEATDGPTFIGLSWPGGGGGTPTSWPDDPGGDTPGSPGTPTRGGGGPGVVPNPPRIGGGPVVNPQPPVGSLWYSQGCFAVCISTVSQAAADLCAAQQQYLCDDPQVNTTDHTPAIDPTTGNPVPVYYNRAKQCQFSCGDGTFNVFTVPAGTFISGISQEDADKKAYSYACFTVNSNQFCLNVVDTTICADEFTSIPVTCSIARRPPILYSISGGALPPGMSLFNDTPSTAVIEGETSVPGNYAFTITAVDDVGQSVSKSCTIKVLGIQTSSLPDAAETAPYSESVLAAGGSGSYTFSAVGLPPGLSMDINGLITGAPDPGTGGTYSVVITVSDA